MARDADAPCIVPGISRCKGIFVSLGGWRVEAALSRFLVNRFLPSNLSDAAKIRGSPPGFSLKKVFVLGGFNQAPLTCLTDRGDEFSNKLRRKAKGSSLFMQLIHVGCYCPTMEANAASFA